MPPPQDPDVTSQTRLQQAQKLEQEMERLHPEYNLLKQQLWEFHKAGLPTPESLLEQYNQIQKKRLLLLEEAHDLSEFHSESPS